MNKLTMQDYIDLEKLTNQGAGTIEQQAFLLSRFYDVKLEYIKKLDTRITTRMSEVMEKVLEEKPTSEFIEEDMKRVFIKKTKEQDQKQEKESIQDRSEILDL